MARQKEFDQNIALDKAMKLFWVKGYTATSIQDLVEHMGIGRRSLYDTFGSKHDLFIAALDRYQDAAKGSIAPLREASDSPKLVIRSIFEAFVVEALTDSDHKGCFVVNSAVELAGQDEAVTMRSKAGYGDMESIFYDLLRQAREVGESDLDPGDMQALAQYLTNAVFGIRVMSKVNPDERVLRNVVDITLSALD